MEGHLGPPAWPSHAGPGLKGRISLVTIPSRNREGRGGAQVNTIKAANFAHFNDLALLHLASWPQKRTCCALALPRSSFGEPSHEVLRRHYLPISCQETQASPDTMGLGSCCVLVKSPPGVHDVNYILLTLFLRRCGFLLGVLRGRHDNPEIEPINPEVQCSLKFFFIMDCQAWPRSDVS